MLYVKIIGAIVVIIAGTSLGISYSIDVTKRHRELLAVKRAVNLIKSDIEYGGMSLCEIFGHVKRQGIREHDKFWIYLIGETKSQGGDTFTSIWDKAIKKHLGKSNLSVEDVREMSALGKVLGSGDRGQQDTMMNLYLDSLNLAISELENEKKSRQKIYNSLGIVGSIFLVILLC